MIQSLAYIVSESPLELLVYIAVFLILVLVILKILGRF